MGDRGNIVVRQSSGTNRDDVWFYTHWSGGEIKDVVKRALSRKQRWDDPSYLARMVFCTLIDEDTDGETGFGISTRISDNEYDIIVVECNKQEVYMIAEDELEDGRVPDKYEPKQSQSFGEFIGMDKLVEEVHKAQSKRL